MGRRQWMASIWEGTDPAENLAMEEYAFDCLPRDYCYLILWQNRPSIIIGKHQNALEEINAEYVRRQRLPVIRRLSGGGAVYHDLGNVNFTFLTDADADSADWEALLSPILQTCRAFGIEASLSGRNDLIMPDGRKFSGNARYESEGRLMHHGTMLIDADLEAMEEALRVSRDKIVSKGVASVRGRVCNLTEYAPGITAADFSEKLLDILFAGQPRAIYHWTEEDRAQIQERKAARYGRWEWNYGSFAGCSITRERRITGCGLVQASLEVLGGYLTECHFHGDFMGNAPVEQLEGQLEGCRLEEEALQSRLGNIAVEEYMRGMSTGQLIQLLLGTDEQSSLIPFVPNT